MCGGFTGEHDEMTEKTAEIVDDNGFIVHLFKQDTLFGTINVRDKSIHYANDVAENWSNGILGEDNEFISKSA
jgi:hypothetical protein